MYFLDHKTLGWELKTNKIKNLDALKYFVGVLIINLILRPIESSGHVAVTVLAMSIDIILVLIFYLVNRMGDNKTFIERYFVLQFPVVIKMILIGVPCILLFQVLLLFSNPKTDAAMYIFSFLLLYGLQIWFMVQGLRIASGQIQKEPVKAIKSSK